LLDPYQALGVARDCSREEVVAAFRDKVWLAHPDRGGNEQAFIELCSAYQTILKEVRPSKRGRRPAPAARGSRPSGRQAPEEKRIPKRPRKPDRKERRPKAPDTNWEPDLILSAGVGRNGQPAPPADPTWNPDLILADETPSDRRPSQPPDPNWKPDVVLNDESTDHDPGQGAAVSPGSEEAYRSLFQRISAGSPQEADKSLVSDLMRVMRPLLILIFVAWIVGTIWLCKVMWDESNEAARATAPSDFRKTPRSS
jgi:curved DNA-binding protein CbpA